MSHPTCEATDGKKFGIVLTAKMRHGDLWDAAKKAGSNAHLSRQLGVCQVTLGRWVNLQEAPSRKYLQTPRGQEMLKKLFAACGKTDDELWPDELRDAIRHGKIGKRIEERREVGIAMLSYNAQERLTLPSPEDVAAKKEANDQLARLLDQLTPRRKLAVTLRFGLDGGGERDYREVGEQLGVTGARAREIVLSGLNKLREWGCTIEKDFLEVFA